MPSHRNHARSALYSLAGALAALAWSVIATAAPIVIPGTEVTFEPPAGFTKLTADELSFKFPRGGGPDFAVGNDTRATTIACDVRAVALPPDQLQDAMNEMMPAMEKSVPGLQWKQHGIINMHGHPWIYLEMTSQAVDTGIHNVMLLTSLRGGAFVCNFNSTTEEYPRLETALLKSMQSIALP